MPEEINRVLTNQISDLLFTTERGALDNLKREGIDPERVHFVGNVMIDSLMHSLEKATPSASQASTTSSGPAARPAASPNTGTARRQNASSPYCAQPTVPPALARPESHPRSS